MQMRPWIEKIKQHLHTPAGIIIAVMALVIIIQAVFLLLWDNEAKQFQTQSRKEVQEFLETEEPKKPQLDTGVLFKNVRFCWQKDICAHTDSLTASLTPLREEEPVIFDDPTSFLVNIHQSQLLIPPETLQGMLNKSIFNYPDSSLKDLVVKIAPVGSSADGQNHVSFQGNLKYLLWIPFEMDSILRVDAESNSLVIDVQDLQLFGFVPAKWLIDIKPFHLDRIIKPSPNTHLSVKDNLMMIKPFGLFPPPHIDGQIKDLVVTEAMIRLDFEGETPMFQDIPATGAPNYIYLNGGSAQFGPMFMSPARIQVIDKNPDNLFTFSMPDYWHHVAESEMKLESTGTAIITMPDHN